LEPLLLFLRIDVRTVFAVCPQGRLGKESLSGEAGRPASPSAEVRVSFEARRAGAFTLDQPIYRGRRGGPAAHRDLRRPGPEDMSRTLRIRDRPVSLANSRLVWGWPRTAR